jgi:hypothetical protein
MNPVIIESNAPINKKVAIIMNKLLFCQYPKSILNIGPKTEYSFTDVLAKSNFVAYGHNDLNIQLNKHNSDYCKLTIDSKDRLFKLEINTNVFAECNDNDYYMKHFKKERRFSIRARSFLRYADINDLSEEDRPPLEEGQINIFKTGDDFYSYLKFFEEQINNHVTKICAIQDFNNGGESIQISIADFCKACKNSFMENTAPPSNKALNEFIDNLIYMGEREVEKITSGIVRITKSLGQFGTYKLYFAGTIVCDEFSVSRFKYMFHPGIHLVARYLELRNNIDSLKHKIERELFRRI